MITVAALGTISFLLGMALTPLFRTLALRWDLVDHPDDSRKQHRVPTPRIGGVAVVMAYAGALLLVFLFTPNVERPHVQHLELLKAMLPGAAIIFITGLLDDLMGLRPIQKLAGEVVGAALALGLGMHFTPGGFPFAAGHPWLQHAWVALPLSLLWLVVCTNAVNLIDGLDGLAAGVGLFASVATLLLGVFTARPGLVLATMPLVGALLAFLVYNFEPASIFLGDSGSLTVGFMLGVFSLVWSQGTSSLSGFAAPLMVLALPLLDVLLAIARRYLRRVPIFGADRGHIHHIVQARGFKPRHTALILYGVCAVAASLALLQTIDFRVVRYTVLLVFVALAAAGIRYLNYVELGAARRAFSRQHIRRMVRDDLYLAELDRRLSGARSIEALWEHTCAICSDMHFVTVIMFFEGHYFKTLLDRSAEDKAWEITLPLGESGYLRLNRSTDNTPPPVMMQALQKLQTALAQREGRHAAGSMSISDAA
jgi:UDP-GlcNAc:undecaprenyl-phosphate GlcNAc-1-phosphate transferase